MGLSWFLIVLELLQVFCACDASLTQYYGSPTEPTNNSCSGSIAMGQKWYNELGSTMIITSYDSDTGVFGGEYQSLVGQAEKWYILTGRHDRDGLTVGWTVNWQNQYMNAHSVTTWSGQFQCNDEPSILTTWLLTSQTSPEDNWESTQVGFDLFTQSPQTKTESTEKAKLFRRRSYPKV